jgi:hypothetical protein
MIGPALRTQPSNHHLVGSVLHQERCLGAGRSDRDRDRLMHRPDTRCPNQPSFRQTHPSRGRPGERGKRAGDRGDPAALPAWLGVYAARDAVTHTQPNPYTARSSNGVLARTVHRPEILGRTSRKLIATGPAPRRALRQRMQKTCAARAVMRNGVNRARSASTPDVKAWAANPGLLPFVGCTPLNAPRLTNPARLGRLFGYATGPDLAPAGWITGSPLRRWKWLPN